MGTISMQLSMAGIPMFKSAYVSFAVGFNALVSVRIKKIIYGHVLY